MVKLDLLLKEGKIAKINELELERYINFFENSYKDNLAHSVANKQQFPRWSIISGYYTMHDITKLLLAKKFRLKVELEVHATAIKVLREVIKNKELNKALLDLIEHGYKEFLTLANDLAEAKKDRVKVQYYTGTDFMHKEYIKRADEFQKEVMLKYLERMSVLLR